MWKVEIVRVYKSSNLLYEHEDKVIFEVRITIRIVVMKHGSRSLSMIRNMRCRLQ